MADPITLPPGAFAAAKAGKPQPAAPAPATDRPAPAAAGGKEAPKAAAKEPEPKADAKPKAEPPKDMTPAEKKIWKIKAGDEEFDFDASDEEAIKREIARARGADKRFKEAAAERQQAERFFNMLKTPEGARAVLQDPRIGIDLKKLAKEVVWEEIQAQQREEEFKKNPEAKAQWERDQKLKEYEAKEARDKASAENARKQADAQRFEGDYETKITEALTIGGIPKTPKAVERMAYYLEQALEHGYDLSAKDLVAQVQKDYLDDFLAVAGGADGEQLMKIFGEAVAEKIRKADLARLRSPESNPFPKRSGQKAPQNAEKKPSPKRQPGKEWKDNVVSDFSAWLAKQK